MATHNQAGRLSPEEHEELMNYVRAGHLLALLHSQARKALKGKAVLAMNHPEALDVRQALIEEGISSLFDVPMGVEDCDSMPGVDFAAVRAKISLAQVLDLLGFVPCERSGNQLRGPCPIHRSSSSRSRSFSANLAQNKYQCFKCGSAGSQLELWAAVKGQSVYTAAVELCNQLGIGVPWIDRW